MASKTFAETSLNPSFSKSSRLGIEKIRQDFPILTRKIGDKPLVYLDNSATLQKPELVIQCLERFYRTHNSNVHRSVHTLSQESTELYEGVRQKVVEFLGLGSPEEVIFTGGTTHSINLVAHGLSDSFSEGDAVLVTRLEHHANFVPWQQCALRKKLRFQIAELDTDFQICIKSFSEHLKSRPKLVTFSAASNVLGVRTPVRKLAAMAKEAGAIVLVDAAQSLAHLDFDPRDFENVDFIAFSSHKIGGPTGAGVLWGRRGLLERMTPLEYGGDMILEVRDDFSRWNELPWRLEAGTPNFADVIGMGAAIDYLKSLDTSFIREHERQLTEIAFESLSNISGLQIFGPKSLQNRLPIFSFTLDRLHPHDLGTFLDNEGIAVRAGHHCAQPLHQHLSLSATTRASFAFYNTLEEVELLTAKLNEAKAFFGRSK